jgi:hypothetical protein
MQKGQQEPSYLIDFWMQETARELADATAAGALQQPRDRQLPLRFPLSGSGRVDLVAALSHHYLLHRCSPKASRIPGSRLMAFLTDPTHEVGIRLSVLALLNLMRNSPSFHYFGC